MAMFGISLFRFSAALLALATLGHTLGGMLGTAAKQRDASVPEDAVFCRCEASISVGVAETALGSICGWETDWASQH